MDCSMERLAEGEEDSFDLELTCEHEVLGALEVNRV